MPATLCTRQRWSVRGDKVLMTFEGCVLQLCSMLSVSIERDFPRTGFHVEFSKDKVSLKLNEPFNNDVMYGMLEGKDCVVLNLCFHFIYGFVEKDTGCTDDFLYSQLVVETNRGELECWRIHIKDMMSLSRWEKSGSKIAGGVVQNPL